MQLSPVYSLASPSVCVATHLKAALPCRFGLCEVRYHPCQWEELCRLESSAQAVPREAGFHTCCLSNKRPALFSPEKKHEKVMMSTFLVNVAGFYYG